MQRVTSGEETTISDTHRRGQLPADVMHAGRPGVNVRDDRNPALGDIERIARILAVGRFSHRTGQFGMRVSLR